MNYDKVVYIKKADKLSFNIFQNLCRDAWYESKAFPGLRFYARKQVKWLSGFLKRPKVVFGSLNQNHTQCLVAIFIRS